MANSMAVSILNISHLCVGGQPLSSIVNDSTLVATWLIHTDALDASRFRAA
jgi:hypothetical protein